MNKPNPSIFAAIQWVLAAALFLTPLAAQGAAPADEASHPASIAPPPGLRVFTCGHSFHATVVPVLVSEIAASAHIDGHVIAGVSMIGASQAIQHFELPAARNAAKSALIAGKVDVLTLSCMANPDDGIASFAKLALQHNPQVRVTLQELWLPEDHWPFDPRHRRNTSVEDFNLTTLDALQQASAPYFKVMDDYVTTLNATLGKPVVFVVPDAQATLLLRARILAGTAPTLSKPSELFRDAWGHPNAALRALSAYCHFAVIYRRSPVGLPIPPNSLKQGLKDEGLNHLLQELAWEAVTHHPLSGVTLSGVK